MNIHLEDQLLHQLEEIARKQQRHINDVVNEIIERYIDEQDDKQFEAIIDELIKEHSWLLNKLAKQ